MPPEFPVPADDAGVALAKRTHWRVYKKPPTVESVAAEPIGSVLTALGGVNARIVLVKVGDDRWLFLQADYAEAVELWRAAAKAKRPVTIAGAALAEIFPLGVYAWCINRMYTAAGTLPPSRKKPTPAKPKRRTKRQ